MSSSTPPIRPEAKTHGSQEGPAPNEDLTIAETLETMRDPTQDRPGEQCFLAGDGDHQWIPDEQVARFIEDSGALHPSDYQAANGISWEVRLFSGF